ncbi:MAG: acyl-CoA dehydrogenase family protein [Deltaproteobacteria bacterium]|nr:acyl-CoA dehydrogenase family protein [Deltaproteobacteria bacterium]
MTPFLQEHEMFRRSLRELVGREIAPHALEWEAAGALPRELFRKLGEPGFLGVRLSEAHGGSGLDFWSTAVLVQELVRCGSIGVAVSVLAHAEFATKVIDRAGTDELKELFVGPAAAGERIGALAVTEPDAGSDVGAIRTRAVRDGGDYVVNGTKTFITNGSIADFATTAVRTGGPGHRGISLVVIPTDAPGFRKSQRLRKIGCHASDTAELSFEDCRVPARYLVGPEHGGFKLIMQGFEGERLVLALICCQQMRLMWEEARRYGHERKAFGQPLLGFQVWRHRLADALTSIEAAEALTYRAIDLYVRGEPCNQEISMAKLFAAEASVGVAHGCAQIFGGNRYMEEYAIGRLQRDSLAFSVGAGTSEVMREIIARTSGLEPREGAR